jgi:hypothetical protein
VFYNSELVAKQLELLRELVPQAVAMVVFVNPASTNTFEATLRDIEPAARAMGLQIKLMRASTRRLTNSRVKRGTEFAARCTWRAATSSDERPACRRAQS